MKKIDITPFDMQKKPVKEKWFLTPIKWALAFPDTLIRRLKVNKVNMEGLKPTHNHEDEGVTQTITYTIEE